MINLTGGPANGNRNRLVQAAARRRCRVLAARRAEARRAAADRRREAERACRANSFREAARWPSRRRARFVARERFGAARLVRPRPACDADRALRFVVAFALAGGRRSLTPARRAFESPIAIACLLERAPCFPSRMCCISSRTNSPACV